MKIIDSSNNYLRLALSQKPKDICKGTPLKTDINTPKIFIRDVKRLQFQKKNSLKETHCIIHLSISILRSIKRNFREIEIEDEIIYGIENNYCCRDSTTEYL